MHPAIGAASRSRVVPREGPFIQSPRATCAPVRLAVWGCATGERASAARRAATTSER
jgi:hypothetical protein